MYRSCYIDPLKCGTWALTREWALACDTMVLGYHYNIMIDERQKQKRTFITAPLHHTESASEGPITKKPRTDTVADKSSQHHKVLSACAVPFLVMIIYIDKFI